MTAPASDTCMLCQARVGARVFRRNDGAWFDDELGAWRHADTGRAIGGAADAALNPHYLESVGRASVEGIVVRQGICDCCRDRRARVSKKSARPLSPAPAVRDLF